VTFLGYTTLPIVKDDGLNKNRD